MSVLIAPARRVLTVGHIPAGDKTVCGEDTTDPAELWQPIPANVTVPTCPPCKGDEELTLL
ncbi:hypothetical protein [Streptosporangium roseum]|uniref:hypothetical protein n=1 Tax=Streptosporangium roseum TaxID=2001 RepID=UPI0004CD6108|nr:hypothetical protein [Streptosporangium roseum]